MNHFQHKGNDLFAEVMVKVDQCEVVRKRETAEELLRGERIAPFL